MVNLMKLPLAVYEMCSVDGWTDECTDTQACTDRQMDTTWKQNASITCGGRRHKAAWGWLKSASIVCVCDGACLQWTTCWSTLSGLASKDVFRTLTYWLEVTRPAALQRLVVAQCTRWPTSRTRQCACDGRVLCPVSSVGRAPSRWKLATCPVWLIVVCNSVVCSAFWSWFCRRHELGSSQTEDFCSLAYIPGRCSVWSLSVQNCEKEYAYIIKYWLICCVDIAKLMWYSSAILQCLQKPT